MRFLVKALASDGAVVRIGIDAGDAEEGRRLLQESSLEFIVAETLDEAARKAVEAGK